MSGNTCRRNDWSRRYIIILHGLGRLTCSGIDVLPSFPGASTASSSSRFVVEGVFRESGIIIIIIIIIIFLHGFGRLTCSGIDAMPSFPGASTASSSSRFVVEGVFRESGVVHSFKVVDPVLFVQGGAKRKHVF